MKSSSSKDTAASHPSAPLNGGIIPQGCMEKVHNSGGSANQIIIGSSAQSKKHDVFMVLWNVNSNATIWCLCDDAA